MKNDKLPSNRYKNKFLNNIEIKELEKTCKSDDTKHNCLAEALNLCSKLYFNYHAIRRKCYEDSNNPRCCIDVNYYIDYIVAIIKSAQFNDSTKLENIQEVENFWRDKFVKTHKYKCKREENTYSVYKRCVLKQLHDFYEDKSYLDENSSEQNDKYKQYDQYFREKWCEILKNEKMNSEDLNITINQSSIKEIVKSNNLPLSSELLRAFNINPRENINITFSIEPAKTDRANLRFDGQTTVSEIRHSMHATDAKLPLEKETEVKKKFYIPRTIVIVPSIFFAIFIICSMFYKFSPIGSWIHTRISKNKKIEQPINYEKTQIFEESEDNQYYIGYDSSPH
ncbi:PIR Superfamily Protein [Plasmodium ovale curtisi]|uniref:PIR Superfamily Protein n=1 Tax=Plasmodium ovale curtisi TaxID=864141 RepID=A0A1A8WP83_PLAOA|nr:PIR Superfamily Protein [Plasmodium ovale curtisi]